jgi:hypothetical protein
VNHRSAVVIIPSQDVWPPIQRIRQQHDRKIRRWHASVLKTAVSLLRGE